MADENATGVSGCSTDSSVRLIKEIEQLYKVAMFDRQNLAFVVKDKIQLLPLNQLQYAADNQFILADTLYFNNLVQNKQELEQNWLVPVSESWLAKRIKLQNAWLQNRLSYLPLSGSSFHPRFKAFHPPIPAVDSSRFCLNISFNPSILFSLRYTEKTQEFCKVDVTKEHIPRHIYISSLIG